VIGFLSPLYLLAGLAVAVPLLIHLMRRRIGARVEFPAVRYLQRAEREHSRKLRLRNLLLMLLRVAAVLAVALAAARPVLRVGGGGHAPTALAIVVDNSLSASAIVGGRPVLDALRAEARAIAERASEGDRLWLVTADGAVRGGARGAVLAAIDGVEPLAGAGDLPAAVRRGAALVRQAGLAEREVAVVSDGQATSWEGDLALEEVRARIWLAPGAPPANRGVTLALPVPPRWTPRGAVRARFLADDSATYRITLGGRTLARGTAVKDEEVTVRVAPAERGWVAGSVEAEPDEMRGDDARHFAVWIGAAPAVAVHPSAGPFARSAVEALVQAERVAVGADVRVVAADEATRTPALILAPADPVRLGAANRALERLGIPWQFRAPRRDESSARARGGPALDGVSVALRYPLQPAPGAAADTLAVVGDEPWVVAGSNYVLVGSPLVPEATTLPVRAAFLPWIGELLTTELSGDRGVALAAAPGERVAVPEGATALEGASGSRVPVAGDSVPAPSRAGVWFWVRNDVRAGALAVNPSPDESDLRRAGAPALAARVRGGDVRITGDAAEQRASLFASAPQRPLLFPLLVLAVGLLLAEAAIAGGGRRRAA
jgi:hypothetical protein